jgi:hypothetical protein
MNKIEIAKKAVCFIAGLGTTKVLDDIIKNNVVHETAVQKVLMRIGQAGIGLLVGDALNRSLNSRMDKGIERIKNDIEEAMKELDQ